MRPAPPTPRDHQKAAPLGKKLPSFRLIIVRRLAGDQRLLIATGDIPKPQLDQIAVARPRRQPSGGARQATHVAPTESQRGHISDIYTPTRRVWKARLARSCHFSRLTGSTAHLRESPSSITLSRDRLSLGKTWGPRQRRGDTIRSSLSRAAWERLPLRPGRGCTIYDTTEISETPGRSADTTHTAHTLHCTLLKHVTTCAHVITETQTTLQHDNYREQTSTPKTKLGKLKTEPHQRPLTGMLLAKRTRSLYGEVRRRLVTPDQYRHGPRRNTNKLFTPHYLFLGLPPTPLAQQGLPPARRARPQPRPAPTHHTTRPPRRPASAAAGVHPGPEPVLGGRRAPQRQTAPGQLGLAARQPAPRPGPGHSAPPPNPGPEPDLAAIPRRSTYSRSGRTQRRFPHPRAQRQQFQVGAACNEKFIKLSGAGRGQHTPTGGVLYQVY